jgi:hypothetical protein
MILTTVAGLSSTNYERVYNLAHANSFMLSSLPMDWSLYATMDTDTVLDAFFLYSLLLDCESIETSLILTHNVSSNVEHLEPALQACNSHMAGPGQPEWNHACNLCTKISEDNQGDLGKFIYA